MKQIQSVNTRQQKKMRMWPLVGALAAAGLASAILGGCALMENNSSYSGAASAGMEIHPMPLITRSEKSPDSYYALGKYYFYQGRLEQAQEAFLEAARLDSGHVDALNGLGVIYDRQRLYESARKVYEAALMKDPKASHVWANLGYSLILAGKTSDAIAPLQRAVQLDPFNAVARQHLAGAAELTKIATVDAMPASQAQTVAATQSDVAASASARSESPVASIVTAKGIEQVEEKVQLVLAKHAALATADAVPSKSVEARDSQHPQQAAQPAGNETREPLGQPQSIIASVVGPVQTQTNAGTSALGVVSAPAPSQGTFKVLVQERVAQRETALKMKMASSANPLKLLASSQLSNLRIEVSNGNGVDRMARTVGAEMRKTGLTVTRITNARPFNKTRTIIICSPELKAVAMELAQAMPSKPKIVLRDISHRHVDVRVVLGADSVLAWEDGKKSPFVVASLDY